MNWESPGSPRDLNRPNRRMRTRMSGGVGGERRSPTAAPYPDRGPPFRARDEAPPPGHLDAFAAQIPNQEVAAQIYAASLLAIEVDTPQDVAYLAYLADLARKTGLDAKVVQNIQQTLGAKV